MEDYIK